MQTRTAGGPFEHTMPIPVVVSAAPQRSRAATTRLAVVVAAGVVALLVVATTAVVLVARSSAPSTPAVVTAPVAAPAPVIRPVVAPAVTDEPGPALVDTNGVAVDAETAALVTRVYRALDANDLDSVREAYTGTGSDNWLTAGPHLRSASERRAVLAALRERPSAQYGYLYASGAYTVQFGQGYARRGLLSITGSWSFEPDQPSTVYSAQSGSPWSGSAAGSAPASSPSASTSSATTDDCGGGSVAVPSEGHPCQDPDTGRGVDRDGTVGVHGLKPCPFGTEVPSDPDEPTRNASTGEVCAV